MKLGNGLLALLAPGIAGMYMAEANGGGASAAGGESEGAEGAAAGAAAGAPAEGTAAAAQPESTEDYIRRRNQGQRAPAEGGGAAAPQDGAGGQPRDPATGQFAAKEGAAGAEADAAQGDAGKAASGGAAKDDAKHRRMALGAEADAAAEEAYRLEVEIAQQQGVSPPPPPRKVNWETYAGEPAAGIRAAVGAKYDSQRRLESVRALHGKIVGAGGADGGAGAKPGQGADGQALPPDTDPNDPMPKYEDDAYASHAEFTVALTRWATRQELKAQRAQDAQAANAQSVKETFRQLAVKYGENVTAMEAVVPGIENELADAFGDLTVPATLMQCVMESDQPALVALELARSPDKIDRLAGSDVRTQAREIGKLDAAVTAKYKDKLDAAKAGAGQKPAAANGASGAEPPKKPASKAPPPPSGLERGGATPPKSTAEMSTEEFIHARNAADRAKGKPLRA